MNRTTLFSLCLGPALLTITLAAQQPSPATTWALETSPLTYHMSHPVHEVDGTSHAAKGKGVCKDGQCDFLLAVPVKTFDSGDTNRDLHMLQVTRGAQFPYVTVRFHLPESALASASLLCDLEVQFAGQTVHYSHVSFQQSLEEKSHQITGSIPATLTDFKIEPPTFLLVPIKNDIPVKVDMIWHLAN